MARVLDVAAYILKKQGEMTAMKLQKLVYYAQAWSLVWDEKALFQAKIEAWANGPVAPQLYQKHRGQFKIKAGDLKDADSSALSTTEKQTVDAVLKHYGNKESQWLSDLTHAETPWKEARGKLLPGVRGNAIISHAAMAEYYSSL